MKENSKKCANDIQLGTGIYKLLGIGFLIAVLGIGVTVAQAIVFSFAFVCILGIHLVNKAFVPRQIETKEIVPDVELREKVKEMEQKLGLLALKSNMKF